ncbi:MAG: FAD-dependent oxidoreductase [Candidatus Omnitrophica bacterium]|nr:FAD-dependent oxidoreductase [Candidatus Omnitrophota bacterium]
MEEVVGINPEPAQSKYYEVTTNAKAYYTKAIIIATGSCPTELGIPGEAELRGKGVSYCATCDGPLFKDKDIVVIGGGNTAVGEAVYLTRFVRGLTLVHRRDNLRATKILQERLLNNKKVEIKWNCVATEILGSGRVNGIKIRDVKTGKEEEILANGVFIFAGIKPNTDFLKGKIELDDKGFIITKENMETSMPGIFACGDARKNMLKQVITSCAEGAQAAHSCAHYIESLLKD